MKSLKQILEDLDPIPEEQIFTIVKPGFLEHCSEIESMFQSEGWKVVQSRVTKLTLDQAKELYKVHKTKDFYEDLCQYMSSGLSRAYIYKRIGLGTSKLTFLDVGRLKDRIRDLWGIDDCKNVMHSSDSFSAMEHEKSIYF